MILSQGLINSGTPRFRRYHEGRFYKFNFDGIKKKYKDLSAPTHPDFFKAKYVPEDIENSKHFKWNDIEGIYDSKEWDPVPWGLEKAELKTILADSSILTQNFILQAEKSKISLFSKVIHNNVLIS